MTYKTMTYCVDCGAALEKRFLKEEGLIPYCPNCELFRFPIFNTACSMIIMNQEQDKILLIKQYNRPDYILTAGYINQGEDAEATVRREIKEELGLEVTSSHFNQSQYFEKSNTLMLNFAVTVTGQVTPNHEVDEWTWFDHEEAKLAIKDGSLAEHFLLTYLTKTR